MSAAPNGGRRRRCSPSAACRSPPATAPRRTITAGTDLDLARGESDRDRRRVGLGQVADREGDRAAPAAERHRRPGAIRFDGLDLMALAGARDAEACAGRRISMLLQDPFTMMNPLMRCGRAHRGDALRPAGVFEPRRAIGGGRAPPRRGRHHRRGRAAPHAVPALGRHVPARRARRGARARPGAAHRRRAFDGARRHHPGRDHEAPEARAGRARHEPDPDHPRPSAGLLHLRPRLRALRGLAAGGRRRAERRARPAPSLHARPAAFRAAGRKARAAPDRDPRLGPAPRRRRGPLRLRRPLRLGSRRLPSRQSPPLVEIAPGRFIRLHPPARHRGGDARACGGARSSRRPRRRRAAPTAAADPRARPGQDLPRPPRPRRFMR